MGYRVRRAREERNLREAERLQELTVVWDRRRATPFLSHPPDDLDAGQKNQIRTLAASLHELGEIQREEGSMECVAAYKEALKLSTSIGEQAGAAICAFNLGHAYLGLTDLRDLTASELWYRNSLDLRDPGDGLGKGKCIGQLGEVVLERFQEAKAAGHSQGELMALLNQAARSYYQALDLLPQDAVNDLAVIQHRLGSVYREEGDLDRALSHYRQAIQYHERIGNHYEVAQVRLNVALALLTTGQRADSLEYARAARNFFSSVGKNDETRYVDDLISQIQEPQIQSLGERSKGSSVVFEKTIMDLVASGLVTKALDICQKQLNDQNSPLSSLAQVRSFQFMLLLDRGAEVSNTLFGLGQGDLGGRRASISLAAFLATRFTAGAPIDLQELTGRFEAVYGTGALRYALQLAAYKLEFVLWQRTPQHGSPKTRLADHDGSPLALYRRLVDAATALTASDAEAALGLISPLAANQAAPPVSNFASTFLLARTRLALGDASGALDQTKELYSKLKMTDLTALRHQILFFAVSAAFSKATRERADGLELQYPHHDLIASMSTAQLFRDDMRELACAPIFSLTSLRAKLYLGILEGSEDLLSTCVAGYRRLITWVMELRKLLGPHLSPIEPGTEQLAYQMLFPSLSPGFEEPDERLSGAMLFDNVSSNFHYSDLKYEILMALIFLSSLLEARKRFLQAASCWEQVRRINLEITDLILDMHLEQSPLIAQGRLLRLAGKQDRAAELLEQAERVDSARTDSNPLISAQLYRERALIELGRENLREALSLFREALRNARESPPSHLQVQILYLKGCLELRMGYSRWRQTLQEVRNLKVNTLSPEILQIQALASGIIERMEAQ